MTNEPEKSDPSTVATKLTNGAGRSASEPVERREGAKGNTGNARTHRTPSRGSVFPGLDRVRERARQEKKERFTALLHHLTIDLLRESYYALKRRAAPGVDGVSWQQYESGLEERLIDLHGRVHRLHHRHARNRGAELGIVVLVDEL